MFYSIIKPKVINIPFLKKLGTPEFSLNLFAAKPSHAVGIDIGTFSTKVIQLRYEKERGILETYGELLHKTYFKSSDPETGFQHRSDQEVASLLKDLLREANVTSQDIVFSVPANASFVTSISLPPVTEKELREAVPYEARRFVPIPIAEVALDWEILGMNEEREKLEVLLIAVPKEIIEKFKRVSALSGLALRALEVETFSMARSLGGNDLGPTAFINFGHRTTTLAITDRGKLRVSHNFGRGSQELTKTLERGLGINYERAEAIKKEVGISEKIEEKEIASVIAPFVETLLAEVERFISIYNRKAPRAVQKINLTGGGSNLKGLVEHTVARFGLEVNRGNPFARTVTPAFMQPLLRELGPSFSVAVGLALHQLTAR